MTTEELRAHPPIIHTMSPSDHPTEEAEDSASDSAFQLSAPWILIGLLAIALGVGCGLIMSSATFLR